MNPPCTSVVSTSCRTMEQQACQPDSTSGTELTQQAACSDVWAIKQES